MRKLLLYMLLLCVTQVGAQKGISFINNDFEAALEKAKTEGKDIFLDTYAPWCKPCKKMDRVFKNSKVDAFYNEHFINVKINVDLLTGKTIADKYGVVFLPTMLVIDKNGYVKQRIDGVMTAEQMLQIGESLQGGKSLAILESAPKKPVKLSKKVSSNGTGSSQNDEKILFVLDDPSATHNPDYLYHEAFFRLQQLDGSHDSIVQRYLKTQEDWSTEKNMKFIVNFMDNTNSEMFEYFTKEQANFSKMMGAVKYRNTLEILINDCFYRQIPRPSAEKVEKLYAFLYPRKAAKYTYQYLLKRYEEEEEYDKFVALGEEYLETLIKPSAELLHKLGKYKCLNANKKELKVCIFRVEESLKIAENPNFDQYLTLAKLYFKQGKEKKAIDAAERAKALCLGDTEASNSVDNFMKKIVKI